MQTNKMLFGVGLLLTIWGCQNRARIEEESMAMSATAAAKMVSSSAAFENNKDTTRKFVRTAELKFKVKSVIKATYDIEDITSKQGGFVTFTNLTSNINDVSTTAISKDSTLETTHYSVSNTFILRIPNTKLDTTLKEISRNIDYLDYRIIKAEDVALQILSNNLVQKRSAKNEERLTNAIDNRGKKLNETTVAEEVLLSKQEQADNAKILNLSLDDQINFSTISLSIYQRQTTKREVVLNEKNIDAYEPGFATKLLESLKYGWEILVNVVVFLVKFWALFLFVFATYWLYKIYVHNLKSKKISR